MDNKGLLEAIQGLLDQADDVETGEVALPGKDPTVPKSLAGSLFAPAPGGLTPPVPPAASTPPVPPAASTPPVPPAGSETTTYVGNMGGIGNTVVVGGEVFVDGGAPPFEGVPDAEAIRESVENLVGSAGKNDALGTHADPDFRTETGPDGGITHTVDEITTDTSFGNYFS